MLALSSLSTSRRFVAVMYTGAVLFASAVYQVLRGITGTTAWSWVSLEDVFDALAIAIFRAPVNPPLSATAALAAVAAIAAASIFILDRRVRAVDAVA
jgi:hypothetical protein